MVETVMKNNIQFFLALSLLITLTPARSVSLENEGIMMMQSCEKSFKTKVDKCISAYEKKEEFSGSILITKDGKKFWSVKAMEWQTMSTIFPTRRKQNLRLLQLPSNLPQWRLCNFIKKDY